MVFMPGTDVATDGRHHLGKEDEKALARDSEGLLLAGRSAVVTGGGSGNPVSFDLPGGAQARFSTGAFHRLNGALIEGQGIEPDFPVLRTIQDVIDGRDTVLETAQEVLLSGRE